MEFLSAVLRSRDQFFWGGVQHASALTIIARRHRLPTHPRGHHRIHSSATGWAKERLFADHCRVSIRAINELWHRRAVFVVLH
jgi:hypothetical protein